MSSPPIVKKKIAGSLVVESDYLRKKLGRVTFDVWTAFIWRRNEDGVSFASASLIGEYKKISKPSVKRACDKLEKVGLIRDSEWVISRGKRRFKRVILGDFRKGIITIPKPVKAKLEELPKWGGARKGAGRKIQDDMSSYPNLQDDISSSPSIIKPSQQGIKMIPSWDQDDTTLKRTLKEEDNFLKEIMAELFAPSDDFLLEELSEHLFFPDMNQIPDEPPRIDILEMPPYPSVSRIGVAKLPPPPLIDENASLDKKVNLLVTAYRGSVESRYKKRCYAFSRGSIENSKYYKTLCAATESFTDLDVSPFSWCAFSIDAWLKYNATPKNKSKPPPANWVFSSKRITENFSWFKREANKYGGGLLFYSSSYKDLYKRYDGLRRACFREELTHDLMEKFFPGGWEKFYERAKKEASADQVRLYQMMKRGEFLW